MISNVQQKIMQVMNVADIWSPYWSHAFEETFVEPSPIVEPSLVVESSPIEDPTPSTTVIEALPSTLPTLSWLGLAEAVQTCQQCSRRSAQRPPFFGIGQASARFLLISDRVLAPFSIQGKSSGVLSRQLLQEWFAAVGISFEQDVFATHVLKCPDAEGSAWNPTVGVEQIDGVAACSQYIRQQIQILRPEKILMLGKFVAQVLFPQTNQFQRLQCYDYVLDTQTTIPATISFPVRHLLEQPSEKRKAWQDIRYFVEM